MIRWSDRRERLGETTYGQRLGINPVLDQGDAVRELLAVEVRILPPLKEYSQLSRSIATRAIQIGWGEVQGTGTGGGGTHTSSVAISCRMSMTSRAAWRLSTSGAGGMVGAGKSWCCNGVA